MHMEFAGEVAIVFCMSFVLVCIVISLAGAEWEGHEDEPLSLHGREPRAAGAQSRPQKHLAATSCGERVTVVETMPAPKHERITRTEKAVVRDLEGKGKDEGNEKQKTREERRLSGSYEPSPSTTRSKGMRCSSSHESSTPTQPKGMRCSTHESLTSVPFEDLRRSSSHGSLQLRQQLIAQKKKLQSLTPTRQRESLSRESLTSTEGDHFRRRHTASQSKFVDYWYSI